MLPYASLNERRDAWRKDFHDRFAPLVRECKTPGEAAVKLNATIFKMLGVQYHATLRPKPDQSPYESIAAHYASCTGLAILLVDACRAVGVPARIVAVPHWTGKTGNHTWVEVWDGAWHYTGAAEPAPLDRAWFTADAAGADPVNPLQRIYASSFRKTGLALPLVWAMRNQDVSAVDVTARYAAHGPAEKKSSKND